MPIYEYKCDSCNETFEVLQNFSDEPLTECIACHKGPVKKLMSVSSFVLKGAGFYVNDYKKPTSSDSKAPKSTSTPAPSEAASSTTPSSSTPTDKD